MKKGYEKVEVVNKKPIKVEMDRESPTEYKQVINLKAKDLADIKKWDVDKEYKVTMTLKMIGKHSSNFMGEGEASGEFEVVKAEAV